MTYDWYQAWYSHFSKEPGPTTQPSVLVLKRDGSLAGISPLICIVASRFGFPVLQRLQFNLRREWDYNDLVLGDDPAGQSNAVVEYLAGHLEKWDLVDLRDLRDTGGSIECITNALARAELPFTLLPEEERCPYMPIDGPWSEVLSRRASVTRHTFRNLQSRLDRMRSEGLRVRILDDPAAEPDLLGKMTELEARRHVGGEPSHPFLGLYPDVFASLFDALGPKGWLCVALMELNERLLAWHLLFRCGGKLWGYLTAYDHEFSRLSPGKMLHPPIVDYAFTRGYTEYDFLNGEEPYKLQWATAFHQTYRLLIWNRHWMSRLRVSAYFKLRPGQLPQKSNARCELPDASVLE